jgi:hypothetical protein
MIHIYKGKAKYILAGFVPLLFLLLTSFGSNKLVPWQNFNIFLTNDTLPKPSKQKTIVKKTTISDTAKQFREVIAPRPDTAIKPAKRTDTVSQVTVVDTFSIKYSKDALEDPIVYHADDSMVLDVPGKKIMLYGKENKTTYQDNELVAPMIMYDQRTNMVTAHLQKDSLGNVVSYASFKQADFQSESDTLRLTCLRARAKPRVLILCRMRCLYMPKYLKR